MNVQRRIVNKVFGQFINGPSEAISSFDVQRSMLDVRRYILLYSRRNGKAY